MVVTVNNKNVSTNTNTITRMTANDKENVLKSDNNSNKTNSKTNDNDNDNDKGISCNDDELLLLSSGNKKKNNSTTTNILSRSYEIIKKEIAKNVIRHKLQKLRHLVLPGVISSNYLENDIFYHMHKHKLFQPQTVTYNGGIANVKKWKISSYLEVMEGGVPCTNPNLKLLEIFRPLLETCDDLFLVWYKQQHACNSKIKQQNRRRRRRTCKRLMTFVTRYTPAPGEQALLKHIDGAGKVDGSCVIALPIDKWSAPYDVNSFEGHGGGLTFWDGKEPVPVPVPVPVPNNDKDKDNDNDDYEKEKKEAIKDVKTTKTTMISISSKNKNQNNDSNAVEVEETKNSKTTTATTTTTAKKNNNMAQQQKFRPREIHYETRSGDIAFIDRAVWHQADPITKGTRFALVIFYKVMYEDDDEDDDDDNDHE